MRGTGSWNEAGAGYTLAATDLALRLQDAGAAALIYTDIARDGC